LTNYAKPAKDNATRMNPTDTYRDTFLAFLAQGMTYSEALAEFDEQEFSREGMAEIFRHEAHIELWSHEWITADERRLPALFSLLVRAQRERADAQDFEEKSVPLMMAGWTSEVPECYRHNSSDFWRQCPTMSLYWRAPSRRPGKPGRRYLSTNQAFNAMNRAQAQPEPK
jgi:hypothetical protein